jgi:hypothetical protein
MCKVISAIVMSHTKCEINMAVHPCQEISPKDFFNPGLFIQQGRITPEEYGDFPAEISNTGEMAPKCPSIDDEGIRLPFPDVMNERGIVNTEKMIGPRAIGPVPDKPIRVPFQ